MKSTVTMSLKTVFIMFFLIIMLIAIIGFGCYYYLTKIDTRLLQKLGIIEKDVPTSNFEPDNDEDYENDATINEKQTLFDKYFSNLTKWKEINGTKVLNINKNFTFSIGNGQNIETGTFEIVEEKSDKSVHIILTYKNGKVTDFYIVRGVTSYLKSDDVTEEYGEYDKVLNLEQEMYSKYFSNKNKWKQVNGNKLLIINDDLTFTIENGSNIETGTFSVAEKNSSDLTNIVVNDNIDRETRQPTNTTVSPIKSDGGFYNLSTENNKVNDTNSNKNNDTDSNENNVNLDAQPHLLLNFRSGDTADFTLITEDSLTYLYSEELDEKYGEYNEMISTQKELFDKYFSYNWKEIDGDKILKINKDLSYTITSDSYNETGTVTVKLNVTKVPDEQESNSNDNTNAEDIQDNLPHLILTSKNGKVVDYYLVKGSEKYLWSDNADEKYTEIN